VLGRLPKLPFPKFDGDNPRLWCRRCEKYFAMYGIEESLWISVSEHYLEGSAARWFQSIESQLRTTTWSTFCQSLHDRFNRDQH